MRVEDALRRRMTDIPDKPSPANISNAVEGSGLAVDGMSVDWNWMRSDATIWPVGDCQVIELAVCTVPSSRMMLPPTEERLSPEVNTRVKDRTLKLASGVGLMVRVSLMVLRLPGAISRMLSDC